MITGHLIRFYGGATLFDLFWLQDLGHYTGDNMLHGWPNKDPKSNQITDQKISINADKKSPTITMIFLIGQVTKAPVMTMLSPLLKCKVW